MSLIRETFYNVPDNLPQRTIMCEHCPSKPRTFAKIVDGPHRCHSNLELACAGNTIKTPKRVGETVENVCDIGRLSRRY